jgi:pilus assembly protein CpaB
VAVLFGALTAVLFYALTSRGGSTATVAPSAGDTQVVVAKGSIPQRTTITAELLQLKSVPLSAAATGAFADLASVVGKVTRYPVAANQQVTADSVVDTTPGAVAGLSGVVPVGQRAISIQASQIISAGGLILPGDFVDLVWSWPKTDPLTSKTILRNVQVVAVAQAIVNSGPAPAVSAAKTPTASGAGAAPIAADTGKATPDAVTITLLLSEQDAQKVFLAEQNGLIRATLRNKGDQDVADTGVADVGQLVPIDAVKALPDELRPANFHR